MRPTWFKVDTGILSNAKVVAAGTDALLVYLACLSVNQLHERGGKLHPEESTDAFLFGNGAVLLRSRITVRKSVQACIDHGLLSREADGSLVIVGYDDSWAPRKSTDRVRKHREKKRSRNVPETPVKRTEQRRAEESRAHPPAGPPDGGSGGGGVIDEYRKSLSEIGLRGWQELARALLDVEVSPTDVPELWAHAQRVSDGDGRGMLVTWVKNGHARAILEEARGEDFKLCTRAITDREEGWQRRLEEDALAFAEIHGLDPILCCKMHRADRAWRQIRDGNAEAEDVPSDIRSLVLRGGELTDTPPTMESLLPKSR